MQHIHWALDEIDYAGEAVVAYCIVPGYESELARLFGPPSFQVCFVFVLFRFFILV